ncbi:family mg2+ transporter protein [Cystoisospora suis]|uniref:Family mg2+ transporter protein n=1 Tax=Cystoisospora suis TaxID=483139 RepID=A0A2C6KNV8_9APIC|nr:family mg2+ transporter protein [Cystoisospora suis]
MADANRDFAYPRGKGRRGEGHSAGGRQDEGAVSAGKQEAKVNDNRASLSPHREMRGSWSTESFVERRGVLPVRGEDEEQSVHHSSQTHSHHVFRGILSRAAHPSKQGQRQHQSRAPRSGADQVAGAAGQSSSRGDESAPDAFPTGSAVRLSGLGRGSEYYNEAIWEIFEERADEGKKGRYRAGLRSRRNSAEESSAGKTPQEESEERWIRDQPVLTDTGQPERRERTGSESLYLDTRGGRWGRGRGEETAIVSVSVPVEEVQRGVSPPHAPSVTRHGRRSSQEKEVCVQEKAERTARLLGVNDADGSWRSGSELVKAEEKVAGSGFIPLDGNQQENRVHASWDDGKRRSAQGEEEASRGFSSSGASSRSSSPSSGGKVSETLSSLHTQLLQSQIQTGTPWVAQFVCRAVAAFRGAARLRHPRSRSRRRSNGRENESVLSSSTAQKVRGARNHRKVQVPVNGVLPQSRDPEGYSASEDANDRSRGNSSFSRQEARERAPLPTRYSNAPGGHGPHPSLYLSGVDHRPTKSGLPQDGIEGFGSHTRGYEDRAPSPRHHRAERPLSLPLHVMNDRSQSSGTLDGSNAPPAGLPSLPAYPPVGDDYLEEAADVSWGAARETEKQGAQKLKHRGRWYSIVSLFRGRFRRKRQSRTASVTQWEEDNCTATLVAVADAAEDLPPRPPLALPVQQARRLRTHVLIQVQGGSHRILELQVAEVLRRIDGQCRADERKQRAYLRRLARANRRRSQWRESEEVTETTSLENCSPSKELGEKVEPCACRRVHRTTEGSKGAVFCCCCCEGTRGCDCDAALSFACNQRRDRTCRQRFSCQGYDHQSPSDPGSPCEKLTRAEGASASSMPRCRHHHHHCYSCPSFHAEGYIGGQGTHARTSCRRRSKRKEGARRFSPRGDPEDRRGGRWEASGAGSSIGRLTYRDCRQAFTDVHPIPSIEIRRHVILVCLPPVTCFVLWNCVYLVMCDDLEPDQLISQLSKLTKHYADHGHLYEEMGMGPLPRHRRAHRRHDRSDEMVAGEDFSTEKKDEAEVACKPPNLDPSVGQGPLTGSVQGSHFPSKPRLDLGEADKVLDNGLKLPDYKSDTLSSLETSNGTPCVRTPVPTKLEGEGIMTGTETAQGLVQNKEAQASGTERAPDSRTTRPASVAGEKEKTEQNDDRATEIGQTEARSEKEQETCQIHKGKQEKMEELASKRKSTNNVNASSSGFSSGSTSSSSETGDSESDEERHRSSVHHARRKTVASDFSEGSGRQPGSPKNHLPFEFAALECIFFAAFQQLNSDILYLERKFAEVHRRTSKGTAEVSSVLMDSLHSLKEPVALYEDRVSAFDKAFDELLSNSADLHRMELTALHAKPDLYDDDPYMDHVNPDLEILLEYFDQEMDQFKVRVRHLKEGIDNTERLISLRLSLMRNRLIQWELAAAVVSSGLAIGTCISGLFGMNLENGFEDGKARSHETFLIVSSIVTAVAFFSIFVVVYLIKTLVL